MIYTAYFWGILPDKELNLLLDDELVEDLLYKFNIKRQYESKIDWAGIIIEADEDYRTAFKAQDAAQHIRDLYTPRINAAKKQWDAFAEEFTQTTKLCLPVADLLIVREYD